MDLPTAAGNKQQGVTYLVVLVVIAILGTALAAIGTTWETVQQRDREQELLFIGNQFRRAIMLYYESSPGNKQYPMRLEDLLADARFLGERRYLRQVYTDPMTRREEWGLVMAPTGGITGVYSLSTGIPIKKSNFQERDRGFANAGSYSDWKFSYVPLR